MALVLGLRGPACSAEQQFPLSDAEKFDAVDAEADPQMAFGSLMKLERYARIDFGIRISLPYENDRIRD